MFYLIDRDYATMILDFGAVLLIVSILYLLYRHRNKDRIDIDCFIVLLVLNIFIAIGDTLAYLFEEKDIPNGYMISTFGMTVFYVSFVLVSMAWLQYCRVRFSDRKMTRTLRFAPEYLPGQIMVLLIFVNIFTGWIFRYDESAVYHRGPLFLPMYIVMAVYIIAGFLYISKYREKSSGKALVPVWIYGLPIVFGVVFTFMIEGSASFAPIGIAMSFTFTHMGTVNEVT